MPNDAKLGLVVGVGLVIAIGVVFFRKEPPPNASNPPGAAAPALTPVARGPHRLAPVRPASRAVIDAPQSAE